MSAAATRRALLLGAAVAAAAGPSMGQPIRMVMPQFSPPRSTGAPGALEMSLWRSMPVVSAMIDGKGPFALAIDTGAQGYLHLTSAVAEGLGLTVAGQVLAVDPSGRNPVALPRYQVGKLALGTLTFHDIAAEGLAPTAFADAGVGGIIGIDTFDALTLTLDFKRRRVLLEAAPLPQDDGAAILGYEAGPAISLPVKIGDVLLPAHLDTGQTRAALIVPEDALAKLPVKGPPRPLGVAHTVSQAMQLFSVALEAPVSVGAVRLPIREVAYPSVVPVANLGSMALQAIAVSIDRVSRRVRFAT